MIAICVTSEAMEYEVINKFTLKRKDESTTLPIIRCYIFIPAKLEISKTQKGVILLAPTQENYRKFKHVFVPGIHFDYSEYVRAAALSESLQVNENLILSEDRTKTGQTSRFTRKKVFENFAFEQTNFPLLVSSANMHIMAPGIKINELSNVQKLAYFSKRKAKFLSEIYCNRDEEKSTWGNERMLTWPKACRDYHRSHCSQVLRIIKREPSLLNMYGRSLLKLNTYSPLGIIQFILFFPHKTLNVSKLNLVLGALGNRVLETFSIKHKKESLKILDQQIDETCSSDDVFLQVTSLRRDSRNNQIKIKSEGSLTEVFNALKQGWNQNYGPTVVVFCLDDYLQNTGGVQLFLGIESKRIQNLDGNYISMYPTNSSQELQDFTNLKINLNDKFLGEIASLNICDIFNFIQEELVNSEAEILISIHSLVGHSIRDIMVGLESREQVQVFFYLHDYYSICSSIKLMRNNWEFCGAPKVTSTSCKVCVYGKNRLDHTNQFAELFRLPNLKVVSPSQIASDIWSKSYPDFSKIEIFEHSRLAIDATNVQLAGAKKNGSELRIGFLGFPVESKGWNEFCYLAENNLDQDIKFYAFSAEVIKRKNIVHIPIMQTAQNNSIMTNALVSNKIDLVIVWANWPETYSYITMESLAAGCGIITNYKSGNVAVLAERANSLFQYAHIAEVEKDLKNGRLRKQAKTMNRVGASHVHSNYLIESYLPSQENFIK